MKSEKWLRICYNAYSKQLKIMLIFDSSSIVLNLTDCSNVFLKSSIKVDFVKRTIIFISYFISYYHILYFIHQIS